MNTENQNYSHIALPVETFQVIFKVLSKMSYEQVFQLIQTIEKEVKPLNLEEKEKGEPEQKN